MMKHKSEDQRVQIEEQNKTDHLLHVKIDVINWKLFQIISSIACERWGGKECRAGVEQRNELGKKSFDFYAIQLSYFMKIDDGFIKKLLVISCWRWGERLERCNGGSFTLSFSFPEPMLFELTFYLINHSIFTRTSKQNSVHQALFSYSLGFFPTQWLKTDLD